MLQVATTIFVVTISLKILLSWSSPCGKLFFREMTYSASMDASFPSFNSLQTQNSNDALHPLLIQ